MPAWKRLPAPLAGSHTAEPRDKAIPPAEMGDWYAREGRFSRTARRKCNRTTYRRRRPKALPSGLEKQPPARQAVGKRVYWHLRPALRPLGRGGGDNVWLWGTSEQARTHRAALGHLGTLACRHN